MSNNCRGGPPWPPVRSQTENTTRNARPLFLRGRVFALLGYELVEGSLDGGRMQELRRINYAPAAR